MQIQLEQYENGKPVVLNAPAQTLQQIQKLKSQKKYKELSQLADTLPCNKQKYLLKSNALVHLKQWHQLIKCCDKGLTIAEEGAFYNLKGKALGKLGNHEAKIQCLKSALQIDSKVPAYHRNLGAAYYSLKKYPEAIQCHQNAIELQVKNPINYHNKGAALFRMQNYEQAKKSLLSAIQLDPKLALSYSWLGDCQREMKNYQVAADLYQKAYDISGNMTYLKQKQKTQKQFNLKSKKKFFGLFG